LAEHVEAYRPRIEDVIPGATWPRRWPRRDLNDSDTLYRALLRRREWIVLGRRGSQVDEREIKLLGRPRDEELFLAEVERLVAEAVVAEAVWPPSPALGKRADPEPLSREAVILPRLAAMLPQLGKLTGLTRYRCLLVIAWLVTQIDGDTFSDIWIASLKATTSRTKASGKAPRPVTVPDKLERTERLFRGLLTLWGVPTEGWPATEPRVPAAQPTRTHLDSVDLGEDLMWAPKPITDVLRAILAVPAQALDREFQEAARVQAFEIEKARHGGKFDPAASRHKDWAALSAAVALDRVLAAEMPVEAKRVRLIGDIFDAAYPRGYRSTRHPAGARAPTRRWDPKRLAEWLQRERPKPRR
jgi:hypothetical protein